MAGFPGVSDATVPLPYFEALARPKSSMKSIFHCSTLGGTVSALFQAEHGAERNTRKRLQNKLFHPEQKAEQKP